MSVEAPSHPLLEQKLSVAAIKNGTVIDHIHCGQAPALIQLLGLSQHTKTITIGLNLPSAQLDTKDLIKIEERALTPEEANQIAILSPQATINIIENFHVVRKFQVALPEAIHSVIVCPNSSCITNYEYVPTQFFVKQRPHSVYLRCKYCEKTFSQEQIQDYNT